MTQRVYAHVHAAEMRSLGEAFGQRSRAICESFVRAVAVGLIQSSRGPVKPMALTCGNIRADARTRTANRPITSRVRCQLRHAGVP